MAPIVLGGICHFAVHGTCNDRQFSCIVDVDINTATGADRTNAILDQAKIINGNTVQHFMPLTNQSTQLVKCSWVDYDNADGETGETTLGSEGFTLPANGGILGDSLPSNCCFLFHKNVAGGRKSRNGRMYWPGVPESSATLNGVVSAQITQWNNALSVWMQDVQQQDAPLPPGGSTYSSSLVVVHVPTVGSPSFDSINTMTIDAGLATQRRRLR